MTMTTIQALRHRLLADAERTIADSRRRDALYPWPAPGATYLPAPPIEHTDTVLLDEGPPPHLTRDQVRAVAQLAAASQLTQLTEICRMALTADRAGSPCRPWQVVWALRMVSDVVDLVRSQSDIDPPDGWEARAIERARAEGVI